MPKARPRPQKGVGWRWADILSRDRGAAAVEFALVSLLLITLVFGIAEFGRAWYTQASLSGAAREGVRVYALGGSPAQARASVKSYAPGLGISDGNIVLGTACPVSNPTGIRTTVQVNHTFNFVIPIFGSSITLTGEGEMRCNG